jgi:transposase
MSRRRYELTEEEWELLCPLIPPGKSGPGKRGRPRADDRQMLNGMIWILRSGAPWRDLPERYGSYGTVYTRFREWLELGVFEKMVKQLHLDLELAELLEDEEWNQDSTIVRAQWSASGAPQKKEEEAGE